ncbi:hypothetical protein J6590_076387 [Homalodisca vitripennis]|nr:hypothetical protein J6590_076387 [Homalodisca vitripennis]
MGHATLSHSMLKRKLGRHCSVRRSTTSTVVWRVGGGGDSIVSLFCYTYNTGTGHCTNQCLAVDGLQHQQLCGVWEEVAAVLCLLPGCRRSTTSTVVWRVGGGGGCIVSLFCYIYNTGTGHCTNQCLAVDGLLHEQLCGVWEEYLDVDGLQHQQLCGVWEEVAAVLCLLPGCRRSTTSTVVWRVGGGGGCIVSLFCYIYNTCIGYRTNQCLAVDGLHQLCGEWEKELAAVYVVWRVKVGLHIACRAPAVPPLRADALKDSVVKLDTDEVEVVIATAAYVALRKRKSKTKPKKTCWVHKVFRVGDEEGEFHPLFRRLKCRLSAQQVIFVTRSLPLPCTCRAPAVSLPPTGHLTCGGTARARQEHGRLCVKLPLEEGAAVLCLCSVKFTTLAPDPGTIYPSLATGGLPYQLFCVWKEVATVLCLSSVTATTLTIYNGLL